MADDRMVALEHSAPGRVAERDGPLGRADDVGEQERREDGFGLGRAVEGSQESLGLGQEDAVAGGVGP
jgi:hypothetical protein